MANLHAAFYLNAHPKVLSRARAVFNPEIWNLSDEEILRPLIHGAAQAMWKQVHPWRSKFSKPPLYWHEVPREVIEQFK